MRIYKYILIIFFLFAIFANNSFAENKKSVVLYLFWTDGCPYCAKEKEFLKEIKKKYPKLEIKDYEVSSNISARELLTTMSKSYGINPSGVPVTFVGDKGLVGFNEEIAKELEKTIKICLKKVCDDPLFYKKY